MNCAIRHWRDMEQWVPGGASLPTFIHATTPIEEILSQRIEQVKVDGSLGDWAPITIHFDGSVEVRNRTKMFKGSMYAAYPGDLVFSKIDVRNGALTIIPESFKKVVVTGEYPVHSPDKDQIDASYLALILRAPEFLQQMRQAASGHSGRKRITAALFRTLEIPLPDLAIQRQLATAYEAVQQTVLALEKKAVERDSISRSEFETALGLTPLPELPKRFAQITRFRDIERWGHEGILQDEINRRSWAANYESCRLGDVAEVTHGCSASPALKPTNLRILKISAVTKGWLDTAQFKHAVDRTLFRSRFDLRKGDVLLCRTNGTLAYVGMSAHVESDQPDLIFPDKVMRVRMLDEALDPVFLWRVLQLPMLRKQIESSARTAVGNYAIGSKDVENLEIPCPPRAEQQRLAVNYQSEREKSKAMVAKATALRQAAWRDFVAAVFR